MSGNGSGMRRVASRGCVRLCASSMMDDGSCVVRRFRFGLGLWGLRLGFGLVVLVLPRNKTPVHRNNSETHVAVGQSTEETGSKIESPGAVL